MHALVVRWLAGLELVAGSGGRVVRAWGSVCLAAALREYKGQAM